MSDVRCRSAGVRCRRRPPPTSRAMSLEGRATSLAVAGWVAERCCDVVRCAGGSRATWGSRERHRWGSERCRSSRSSSGATERHRSGLERHRSRHPSWGLAGGDIRKLMFSLSPPLWAPPTRGATWRHRSGGERSRSAAPTSGTMLRHRSGPERCRSAMLACDVTMSCDVARPSQRRAPEPEAAERHRSGLERHRNIAPARGGRAKERHRTPAERHRNIAKA